MNHLKSRLLTPREQKPSSLEDTGGEPLDNSGFEDETPDPDFSDEAPNQD